MSLSTGPVHSETACAVRAVAGVGPGLAPAQLQVWRTVVQFVTQVLPGMAMSLGKDKAKEIVTETEDKQKGSEKKE